jgi:hypothetical protein
MGANLALASRKVLSTTKNWLPLSSNSATRGFSFHLAYDRLVFNGLLFIWGAFKKRKHPLWRAA